MSNNSFDYQRKELPGKVAKVGWVLFIIGAVLGIIGFFVDHDRALFNYLTAYMFILSIGVGGLFLVTLEYITGAVWSVPLRRVPEFLSFIIPLLLILVIPLLFNMHDIFHWTHREAVEGDKILQGKSPYLNTTFFYIRVFVFILIWILFYLLVIRNSRKQDESGDQILTKRNIKYSAIFMPVFAITVTFTSVDWIMSLEPHWFSTIFGVYFFSGMVVGALAAVTLIVVYLKEKGYFVKQFVNDHLYSLGALMFAFINFWGYIAFSQYLLIWYADLPEENFWFLDRWDGAWIYFSIILVIVHFVVPYAALLSQPAKMDPKRLKFASIWILFAHGFDLYWLIMPNFIKGNAFSLSWIDFVFPVAAIGLIIVVFAFKFNKNNLIPVKDPKLERGLNFRL